MLRISQQAAGRIKVPGGTASAIIDLAGSTDDHPAGPVLVAHAIAGAGPRGLSHVEFGPAAPEGSQYDLDCPPRGGGVRGRDYATLPGGPPVPAGDQAAAAAREPWSTGVSNSSTAVPARPWDGARMGDEETMPIAESDHDVGGQPGLSGAAVSN
jgi:hypothetical protein